MDPCLYYVLKDNQLVVTVSCVDNLLIMGGQNDVEQIKLDLKDAFVCKFEGELKEYVGNKIDFSQNNDRLGTMKFTQRVAQKLEDEFKLPSGILPKTPAVAGQVLLKGGDETNVFNLKDATKYQSGTALCMYKMQWSRPDIYNAT